MTLNLGSLLAESSRRFSHETAIISGKKEFSYEKLDALIRRGAASLAKAGFRRGYRLAAYKYPRVVDISDELPKGPTGKILKRAMRI